MNLGHLKTHSNRLTNRMEDLQKSIDLALDDDNDLELIKMYQEDILKEIKLVQRQLDRLQRVASK